MSESERRMRGARNSWVFHALTVFGQERPSTPPEIFEVEWRSSCLPICWREAPLSRCPEDKTNAVRIRQTIAPSAREKISRPSASMSSSMLSGAMMRTMFPCAPQPSSNRPRCRASAMSALAISGAGRQVFPSWRNSTATIAPSPRISPIAWCFRAKPRKCCCILSPSISARSSNPPVR